MKESPWARRVVVTGLGVISPIATGRKKFWQALIQGKNGCLPIKSFDTARYKTHCGAEVKDFQPQRYISKNRLSRMSRTTQFSLSTAKMALEDSGIDLSTINLSRIGVIMGAVTQDPKQNEDLIYGWEKNKYSGSKSKLISNSFHDRATEIAKEFGFKGSTLMISAACASGNFSIGYAYDLIRQGRADIILAGGVESMNQLAYAGFNSLLALDPLRCQPFNRNRKGLIVGEGCGILMLEALDSAQERKAEIYAEILGYGLSCDAYQLTGLHPEGTGLIAAMRNALNDAKITCKDVDYINAYATGSIANDRIETKAIKKVFKNFARKIPVSSIESMIGHTMGASSAIGAAATCLAIKNDVIPPTINYLEPDPECDLDYVPNKARKRRINIAISNSCGFGGSISVLVIKKYQNA